MKIAIPVEEKSRESGVCPSFGRAPYFLVCDTVTKETGFLDNGAAATPGGAGIRAAQAIADYGVKALLTPRCGENAETVFAKAEVLVYRSVPGTAQYNIDEFLAERLLLLNEFHPGFHGHEK